MRLRGSKYTVEKALYFANQKALHVPENEPEGSDLEQIVEHLCDTGMLVLVGSDDTGDYFQTTKAGDRRLLELQIDWRERHGKPVAEHQKKLAALS